MHLHSSKEEPMRPLHFAAVAVVALALVSVSCGDNDNHPAPVPTFTPGTFQCTGPEGAPSTCNAGNVCCGNQCMSSSDVCCEIPVGRPNAGNKFACRNNQACCATGCIQ